MEWFENEIESISSINEFYLWLDVNAIQLAKEHDLINAILKYKDRTKSDEDKQILQHEVDAFCFQITGNRLFSFSYSNGKKPGQILEYPKFDKFQETAFDYLEGRRKTAKDSYLKARYNHLLWKSLKKNNLYAADACKNYIKTIKKCIPLYKAENDGYSSFIGKLYEALIGIVNETKTNVDEIKALTFQILFKSPNLQFWLKQGILEDMLKYEKVFKQADFTNCLSLFEQELSNPKREDDFGWANYRLPTAIKIAQKTKTNIKKWYNEIGDGNVRMAEQELNNDDKRALIKLELYLRAIDAYRLGGNSIKKVATEQKYFELKPKVRLEHYQVDFDEKTIEILKQKNEVLKQNANAILNNSPEYIYSFIGKGSFFPNKITVEKASLADRTTFLDFATTLYFDQNKNIKNSKNEDKRKVLETYHRWAHQTLLSFLHYLIILGIKSGHLTAKNLLKHLVQNSWIGKPKMATDFDGNPEYTNWIHLLAPSIVEFYNQVLAWGESKYYKPSFILCTDSLALKLEGLFRDFSERFGVSTSKLKRNGMEETQIHDILNNERIKNFFNEDDFLFFEYVFSGDGGLNLRNNIAHCFYSEKEYHPDKMLLLISVLLRLGKYNLIIKK